MLAILLLAAALELVELHDPTGAQSIFINPKAITSIREPQTSNREHFARGTNCIVLMANRNFIAVHETCDEVRRKLNGDR